MAADTSVNTPYERLSYQTLRPNALSVQLRLIVALALRDVVEDISGSRMAIFWLVFRPALIVIFFFVMFTVYHRLTPQGMPVLAFLITGWLAWFMFMRIFKDPGKTNIALMMFPQITPLDMTVGNFVSQWLLYTFVFLIFIFAGFLFQLSPFPINPLKVILSYWAVGLFAFLAGLSFFSLARIFPGLLNITILVRRVGHLVTGVFITAAATPYSVLQYMKWNPLFQLIELMREAWWPAYVSPIADPWYVVKALFFMASAGLILERATRRFIK